MFGGQDASGNYLAEVWILRAYNAVLQGTNQSWSGFGNGRLQSGINANGQGVTIEYLTECASAIAGAPSSSGSSSSAPHKSSSSAGSAPTKTQTPGSGSSPSVSNSNLYDTSVVHKSLAAVSVAIFLPSAVLFRLSMSPVGPTAALPLRSPLFVLSVLGGMAAYVAGIIGLATSFSTIKTTASVAKRASSSLDLKTAHGRAGIVLFICFYALVPILYALSFCCGANGSRGYRIRVEKDEAGPTEKLAAVPSRNGSPSAADALLTPRTRHRSLGSIMTPWSGRRSSESASDGHSVPTNSQPSFEVTNRPARARRASGNSLAAFSDPRPTHTPRNLSDMSWLEQRRDLSTVVSLIFICLVYF